MRVVVPSLVLLLGSVFPASAAQFVSAPDAQPARESRPVLRAPARPGPFLGGVPSGAATTDAIPLSIAEAIKRGLEHNLGVLLASDGIDRARAARMRALSDLLPNVTGRVSESRQVLNLAAYGIPLSAGFPSGVVGPFNLFDARVFVSQSVLDVKALNDARAESHELAAARYDYKSARDLIVLVAGDAYAQAVSASARVDVVRSQVSTSEALLTQATDLKQAGIVAGIEVLRAQVQLDTDRQRVTAAQTDSEKAKLRLARLIGLPIGQAFTLTDRIATDDLPDMTLERALERAYQSRPDYQAALERVRAAEASRRAAAGEFLPAVRVSANYGDLGGSISNGHSTYALTGAVEVPIFQGGRNRGRVLDADTDLRGRRADAEDLKASIYYEVRAALLDLQAGTEQLRVATRARELAAEQLTQARDRFAAGASSNIEVIQAQSAAALVNDQVISAIYSINLAKGALVRAVGIAEETANRVLGGVR